MLINVVYGLTALGIIIWLYDLVILRPDRRRAIKALEVNYSGELTDKELHQRDLALVHVQQQPHYVELAKGFTPILLLGILVYWRGDFDFALLLMLLVGLGLLVWIIDKIFWAKKRKEAVDRAKALAENSEEYKKDVNVVGKIPYGIEMARSFTPVLLFVFVLRSFLYEPFQIPSSSMMPGLLTGDFILVNKYAYGLRVPVFGQTIVPIGEPQRGDVMVFYPPHKKQYYIKRVIGLPGDKVEYRDKQLYINDEPQEETLIEVKAYKELVKNSRGNMVERRFTIEEREENLSGYRHLIQEIAGHDNRYNGSWLVPEDSYFMMGDNRDNSADSRSNDWTFVPEKNIVGKAVAKWMFWDRKSAPNFSRAGKIQ